MKTRLALAILAAAAISLPAAALAGGKAVLVTSGAHMPGHRQAGAARTTISWRGPNTVRMQQAGQKDYLLFRDGKAYSVNFEGGHARVMDMGQMYGFMRNRFKGAGHAKPDKNGYGTVTKITRTGRSETVAGIRGDVYRVTSAGPNGKPKTQEWVLTSDSRVVAMTAAYVNAVKAMFPSGDRGAVLTRWERGLPDGERGLLKVGGSYRIVSLSQTTPPASRFVLPAKPMSMQQLMGGH